MINLIVGLILKKGWMLLSNLFISLILFYFVGSVEWSIVIYYLSLNMLGLLIGVGVKSKTSLSADSNEIFLNYYSMIVVNIITVFGLILFYFTKEINNYNILFFSLAIVLLSNINSFYQGFMLNDGLIKKTTDVLVEANLWKIGIFFIVLAFYKKVYLFFILQIVEQVFIYVKSKRRITKGNIRFYDLMAKVKELFYMSVGSVPFIFVSSNFQIEMAKQLPANLAGYFGLFAQIINSIRGVFVFLVTNFQKKMLDYERYFEMVAKVCFVSLIFLVFTLLMINQVDVPIAFQGYIIISLINLTYVAVLVLAIIQNIYKLNRISFTASIFFVLLYFVAYFVDSIIVEKLVQVILIYMLAMLFRAGLVSLVLKKGLKNG